MTEPLDELYLTWLYRQIGDPEVASPSRTYWKLARFLFTKEFIWLIPNDDNRCADGLDLRDEFIEDLDLDIEDNEWYMLGCSMLELLIGLSRRLSFLDDGEALDWFWHLIANLGLRIPDRKKFPTEYAEEVVNTVIFRTYKPDGRGGLFPLHNPDCDQRDAELWHQLNHYLLERG